MDHERLTPRLPQRLFARFGPPGWRRTVLLRRAGAGALAMFAVALAFAPRPGPSTAPILVAAADLTAGATITATDVEVRDWPVDLVPTGSLRDPPAAIGRVLVGAAHSGEPLTDLRLVGAGPVAAGRAAVPIRLTDAGVAALLVPGGRVDVVTTDEASAEPRVLAADAEVLAVLAEEKAARGRIVMVSMPRLTASRVATAALNDQVAVTLR